MWTSVGGRSGARAAALVAVTLAGTLVAGCGGGSGSDSGGTSDAGGDKGPVSFWGWTPGMEKLVAQWNTAHPDVKVDFHRMTGDDGQKVESAVDAGTGPDMVQLSTHDLPDYVIHHRVLDISKYIGGTKDLYTPASWKSVSFGDGVYGVPQGSGPTAMMYRADIFAKYHIPVPRTWDEYVAGAKALHKAAPSVYIAAISPGEIGQWDQDVSQAGGSYFGIDGDSWTVKVADADAQRVASRWQELLDSKTVKVSQMWTPEYWKQVNSGEIATISYAAWFPVLLEANAKGLSGKWRVAPQPTYTGSTAQGDSGGAADIVLKGAKNIKGASEFLTWLNSAKSPVSSLITDGGIFPTAQIGLKDPALERKFPYFGGQKIYDVFRQATLDTPSTWTDGPARAQVDSDIEDGFGQAVVGKSTFAQSLQSAASKAATRLKGMGLSVKGAS